MAKKWHEEKIGMCTVVDDTHIYYCQQGKFYTRAHPPIRNASHLFMLLEENDLLTAWILPESTLSQQFESFYIECASEWDILPTLDDEDHSIMALQGFRRSERWQPTYYAVFPENYGSWQPDNDSEALDNCTNPIELYASLHYLELQLQVPMKQSPGAVGLALLKTYHPSSVFHATVPDDFLKTVTMSYDAQWKRLLTEQELMLPYIHCVDKNSAYLAACDTLYVGIGQPEYIGHPTTFFKSDYRRPGAWHVTSIRGSSVFDGIQLPLIASANTWMWTPTVAMLHTLGYEIDIDQAYVWNSAERVLEGWSDDVWDARDALKNNSPNYKNTAACQRAYETIKVIATRTNGRLKPSFKTYEDTRKKPVTDIHPDWYAMVIDQTRVRMLWRMWKLHQQGLTPFMVYTDGLYIASAERDPKNHKELMLHTSAQRGGYKHAYTVCTEDVKDAFTLQPAELISFFKKHKLVESEN